MSRLPQNDLTPLLLDNTITYYWIGFILADGHYNPRSGFSVTLSSIDQIHLSKLQQYIKGCPVKKLKKYNKQCYAQVRINFGDKKIAPLVADKFGIRRDKTYYPPDLNWINDKSLFLSLFAGYVDGDGSIEYGMNVKTKNKPATIRFHTHSSWKPVLNWMRNKLIEFYGYDITLPVVQKDGYLKWCISDFRLIKKIKIDLDELEIPLLYRKWSKINHDYLTLKERTEKDLTVIKNNLHKTSREIEVEYNIPYYRIIRLRKQLKESPKQWLRSQGITYGELNLNKRDDKYTRLILSGW